MSRFRVVDTADYSQLQVLVRGSWHVVMMDFSTACWGAKSILDQALDAALEDERRNCAFIHMLSQHMTKV